MLTLAGYPTRGNDILGLARGVDDHGDPKDTPFKDMLGLPYTTLGYANGPGYVGASDAQPEGPKRLPHFAKRYRAPKLGRPDLSDVDTESSLYLQEATLPLASETHGGEDVPVYAGGPSAALFHGAALVLQRQSSPWTTR